MNASEGKPYYKIGEVCEITATQPYVLRFWESEFPTLAPRKNRSGQRIYRKRDIELIQRIKTLLYEQEYTIAGARKVLEAELRGDGASGEDASAIEGSGAEAGSARASGDESAANDSGDGRALRDAQARRGAARRENDSDQRGLPLNTADHQLEIEVKNLRAKLAHVEGELRALLDEMDRRDKR